MQEKVKKICDFLEEHQEEYVKLWADSVRLEGYGEEKENMYKVGEFFKNECEKLGFECELIDVGPKNGPTLVAVLGKDRPGKFVYLAGHMDTVFPEGTFKVDGETVKIKDGKIYGPGVVDMKGGLIVGLAAVKALNEVGYNDRPIKFVISGDEDIGHVGGRCPEIYANEAKGAVCAFNLEPGNPGGELVTGRKGGMTFIVKVSGKAAHAGRNFGDGISAINEMAYKILKYKEVTNLEVGTTCNVGVIKGGTVSNAVPEYCEVAIDTRFATAAEKENISAKIKEISESTTVEGTTTEWYQKYGMGSFETTDEGMRFFHFIEGLAKKYGLSEGVNGSIFVGGASDASLTSGVGVPTICGCGVKGGDMHSVREYAIVDSLKERAKMVAVTILNLNEFEK